MESSVGSRGATQARSFSRDRLAGRARHPQHLGEAVDHQVAALGLGDELGFDQIIASGPLARATLRPDRHDDARSRSLVRPEVAVPGDERPDIVGDDLTLPAGAAGHLLVGGPDVADGADPVLAHYLPARRD